MYSLEQPRQRPKPPHVVEQEKLAKWKNLISSKFDDLFLKYGTMAFEKQLLLADLIGEYDWEFNAIESRILFGDDYEFQVDVMGSMSFLDNSWMWIWANEQVNISKALLHKSFEVKSYGMEHSIPELENAHYEVMGKFYHHMGMVLSGLMNADCYYSANYGNGTLLVTITNEVIPKIDFNDVNKIAITFSNFISTYEVHNHKLAFENYLLQRKCSVDTNEDKVIGKRNNTIVTAVFDEQYRLETINVAKDRG